MLKQVPAPKATRADGLWLDDLSVGQTFVSGGHVLTAEAIVAFATEFDPQPYHLDPDAAVGTFFNGIVASGWHTAAISMKLFVEALPIATGLVGAGGKIVWPSAAVPGDVLHVEGVIDKIMWSTSRPGRGSLVVSHRTLNHDGEVRQTSTARLLAWARPAQ